MTPNEMLLDEISREIAKHQFWGRWGFYGLQTMIWASILSSTAAAILTAIGTVDKTLVAILAAVPAFVLTVEAAFRYSDRYQYHDKAAATIDMQKNAYSIRKEITMDELSRWWDQYRITSQLPAPIHYHRKEEPGPPKPAPSQSDGSSSTPAPSVPKPVK